MRLSAQDTRETLNRAKAPPIHGIGLAIKILCTRREIGPKVGSWAKEEQGLDAGRKPIFGTHNNVAGDLKPKTMQCV